MLTELEKRCVKLSYKHKLSHLSSVLTSVRAIEKIYDVKKKDDIFVLGNAHAALALYVVLEAKEGKSAEQLLKKHGVHSTRDVKNGIYVSGGSLGQAETIAVGMALADRKRTVYLVTSDGALAEGCIWEALRIAGEQRLENLRVAVIANGFGAYGRIDTETLDARLQMFYPTLLIQADLFDKPEWLQGIDGHYVVMNKEQYKEIMK